MSNDEQLRYPIGKFTAKDSYTTEEREENIRKIESLPARVEAFAKTFTTKQLSTTYREGGWTARQVLHHISDSHINAYIRIKWTLTEDTPVIKAYNEKDWAETPEVDLDPSISINLLKALHVKFAALLRNIPADKLKREFVHPETKKNVSIERMIALYAWHGEHHLGHLEIISKK